MPLPRELTEYSTVSPKLVNYDFTNIIEGVGYINYYVGTALDSAAAEQDINSSETFYSNTIEIQTLTTGALDSAFVLVAESNYDGNPFTIQQTVGGVAIGQISLNVEGNATRWVDAYLIMKLIKVSGAVETVIGEGRTSTVRGTAGSSEDGTYTLELLLTDTQMNKGDLLRISVEGWSQVEQTGLNGYITWGQDPTNRDGTLITPSTQDEFTSTNLRVAFKI